MADERAPSETTDPSKGTIYLREGEPYPDETTIANREAATEVASGDSEKLTAHVEKNRVVAGRRRCYLKDARRNQCILRAAHEGEHVFELESGEYKTQV